MNAKHKAFADNYLRDPERNPSRAYLKVYAKAKQSTADVNASRLLKNAKILEYIQKFEEKVTEKTVITAEFLLERLRRNDDLAVEQKKLNDSNRALELMGKLRGLFIDKIETKDTTFEEFLKQRYANKRNQQS